MVAWNLPCTTRCAAKRHTQVVCNGSNEIENGLQKTGRSLYDNQGFSTYQGSSLSEEK